MSGAHRPRFIDSGNNEVIVVFIHGFLGSPDQFTELMAAATRRGFAAMSILLPGHGDTKMAFAKATLADWEAHVHSELQRCRQYRRVYLVGHSIGGLLSLNAAANPEYNIAGVAAICSPLKVYFIRPFALMKRLKLAIYRADHKIKSAYIAEKSVRGIPLFVPLWYRVLLQPHKIMRKTRRNLANVRVPVVLIHSRGDETASFKSSEMLDRGLVNAPHKSIRLKNSWHAYHTYEDKQLIQDEIFALIEKTDM